MILLGEFEAGGLKSFDFGKFHCHVSHLDATYISFFSAENVDDVVFALSRRDPISFVGNVHNYLTSL